MGGRKRMTRREAKASRASRNEMARAAAQATLAGAAAAAAAASGTGTHMGGGKAALPRQLRCVHVSLIVYACISIVAHALTPNWLAFITPYCLVMGSCALLLGAAGAPLRGWKSRAAAILADDWRLPLMIIVVWVTLAQGHGMDVMSLRTAGATALPFATFGRHAWVGAAGIQGLCSVVLEYNLTSMAANGLRLQALLDRSSRPRQRTSGRRSRAGSVSQDTPPADSSSGASAAQQASPPAASASATRPQPHGVAAAPASGKPDHEIYGPRRPLLLIITDIAAFVHGITWFFVTASTRTISLPFVLWIAVVALVGEALMTSTLENLPTLRYHGIMWTAAVTCLTLYGWSTNWSFPELPLLQRLPVTPAVAPAG